MQVPTYDNPQAQPAALPGTRVESVASPALLDAGAVDQLQLGRSLERAGIGLGAVAYHMQERENADAVFKTEAQDKADYIAYEQDARTNRQGAYAKGVTKDTATWWKDRISKNVDGLANDEQKRIYSKRATELQLQSLSEFSKFEGTQMEVSHDQTWKVDKINTINLAAANPSADVVASSLAEIKKMNAYQAAHKGWTGEDGSKILKAVNEEDITNLHKQVIQTLAATNKAGAYQYYLDHKNEIAGSQQAEIGQFAERATAAYVGATAAQNRWVADGPKSDTDVSNIDQMKAKIRVDLKDNIYARDAALAEIDQINNDRHNGITARVNNREAQINTMLINGATIAQVQQTPVWAALDGTQQKRIQAIARGELNVEGLDALMQLSNPDVLVGMTRDQVVNLRPKIGDANTAHLLDKWDQYTKNGTLLSEAKIDADQFNEFANAAGLDTTSKDTDMKKQIIATRNKVEQIIGVEQQKLKRPLDRTQRDDVMKRVIDDTVTRQRTFWFDKPGVPAITLTPKQAATAYVNVEGGHEVQLSSIPPATTKAISAELQRQNIPVTQQNIAQAWANMNPKKYPKTRQGQGITSTGDYEP